MRLSVEKFVQRVKSKYIFINSDIIKIPVLRILHLCTNTTTPQAKKVTIKY